MCPEAARRNAMGATRRAVTQAVTCALEGPDSLSAATWDAAGALLSRTNARSTCTSVACTSVNCGMRQSAADAAYAPHTRLPLPPHTTRACAGALAHSHTSPRRWPVRQTGTHAANTAHHVYTSLVRSPHAHVHAQTHTGAEGFVCDHARCGMCFSTAGGVTRHMRTHAAGPVSSESSHGGSVGNRRS